MIFQKLHRVKSCCPILITELCNAPHFLEGYSDQSCRFHLNLLKQYPQATQDAGISEVIAVTNYSFINWMASGHLFMHAWLHDLLWMPQQPSQPPLQTVPQYKRHIAKAVKSAFCTLGLHGIHSQ